MALADYLVGPARPALLIAWGAVGLVLLIACANAASLMIARAAGRRQEIAICRALGAPRSRLVARVLGESLVLAATGGLLGLPLAAGLLRVVVALAPPDQVYVPHAQNPWPTMSVTVRTAGDPLGSAAAMRSAVYAIDPDQAVYNLRPFETILARALAARRFQVFLLSLFAAIALGLAGTGVYSVVAYGVRQRRQEVGVRRALGASRVDVLALAMRDSLRWAAAGLLGGGALAFAAARFLAGALYEVPPADPVTFLAAGAAATAVVLLASLVAARAALRVAPLVALRGE